MGRYRFLDDVAWADAAVEIEGDDLGDLFGTAASALAALMVDPASLTIRVERTIGLEAPRLDLLLYDWLSELIFRKDRDGEIFPTARVAITGEGPYALTAHVVGGPLDPGRTVLGADPKAVTFHRFALEPRPAGWWARVVIDV